jgi:hypothetical protein
MASEAIPVMFLSCSHNTLRVVVVPQAMLNTSCPYSCRQKVIDIGFHQIAHIGIIPGNIAIPIDGGRSAREGMLEKQWYHRCVRSVRVLPRTKYIEIPEPCHRHAVVLGIHFGIQFIGMLANRIGRKWLADIIFHLGLVVGIAIYTRRRSINHPFNPRIARRCSYIDESTDVIIVRLIRRFDTPRHRPHRHLMTYGCHPLHHRCTSLPVADISFHKFHFCISQKRLNIPHDPLTQIIQHPDFTDPRIRHRRLQYMRPDKSCSAC